MAVVVDDSGDVDSGGRRVVGVEDDTVSLRSGCICRTSNLLRQTPRNLQQ